MATSEAKLSEPENLEIPKLTAPDLTDEDLGLEPPKPGSREAIFQERIDAVMDKVKCSDDRISHMLWSYGLILEGFETATGFCESILADEPLALLAMELWTKSEQENEKVNNQVMREMARLTREAGVDLNEIFYGEETELFRSFFDQARTSPSIKDNEYQLARNNAQAKFDQWLKEWKLKQKQKKKRSHGQSVKQSADEFSLHTSQEMDAFQRAQCAGKLFAGYSVNAQAGAIIYERPDLTHQIRLMLTEDERAAGLQPAFLENLVRAQDADAMLAASYILQVLAPPSPLPARALASGWIDFDDVIKKIGWNPQTTNERREMHARIWSFIKYGERAHISGKRTTKYKIGGTGAEIDTTIHGAAWRVMKTETPDAPILDAPALKAASDATSQPGGKPEAETSTTANATPHVTPETPVRAEIVVSKELTALITSHDTAQYLQGAEILGAIPGGKPAGAWARVIGVALASFWRRKSRETIAQTIQPTRRELLEHFAAKVAPYDEVLRSPNPSRVIDYWCGALQMLADGGYIERAGEAAITAKAMRAALPRQNWQSQWLDQTVSIEPGAGRMKSAVEGRAEALPALKARDLKKKPRAKRKAEK